MIELLVVIALIAILAVVVILTLNPAELLKQGRDSRRLGELATLTKAISIYQTDQGGSLGVASTTYVSIPDTSPTCANLGLPSLPTGWAYACAATTTYRQTDGSGWIPVNFQAVSFHSPLGTLPVDPLNTTSTGLYYTYTPSGSKYIVTAIPESQKQKQALASNSPITNYPDVMAQGSDLTISPLFNTSGLVGYWKFDEGSGGVAQDSSGNGNTGTITTPTWVSGKIGSALDFNAGAGYVTVPNNSSLNIPNTLTISAWVNYISTPGVDTATNPFRKLSSTADANYVWYWYSHAAVGGGGPDGNNMLANMGGVWNGMFTAVAIPANSTWRYFAVTYDSAGYANLYLDGVLKQQVAAQGVLATNSQPLIIGSITSGFHEIMDDVRIYNRALSAAEIQAIYNAAK